MQFLVKVEESKAPFFLELMKNLRSVKVRRMPEKAAPRVSRKKPLRMKTQRSSENAEILEGLKSALEEVKLARAGKVKLKTAREFLREL